MTIRTLFPLLAILIVPVALAQNPIRRRAVAPPVATTSDDLIDAALKNGQIDAQTATEYRVFADFDDPRLPAQFRGTEAPQTDSMSVAQAEAQWDSLSPDIQQALTPYTIPPFYKGSWTSPQSKTKSLSVHPLVSTNCGDVDNDNWLWIESASGALRVWWQRAHPEDASVAQGLVADGEQALEQYEALLGRTHMSDGGAASPCRGGSDAIDVALADVGVTQTIPFLPGDKAVPSYVEMSRSDSTTDGPIPTLAHELFHVMQFTYNVEEPSVADNYLWLMEATAQWAMDYHQRPGNSGKEQRAMQFWFNAPDKPLNLEEDHHDYGAYLFFLYLSRTYGDNIIKTIWDATVSNDALSAVDTSIPGGFKQRWPEFALDAWNRGDIQQFQQWDQITDGAKELTADVLQGYPDAYDDLDVDLPGLSAKYFHATFDSTVRSVAFLNGLSYLLTTTDMQVDGTDVGQQYDIEEAPDDIKRGASIQAIIKKNGQWQPAENWTDVKYKMFCMEKPDEKIDELVLVIANTDTDTNRKLQAGGQPSKLIATNIGCEWDGKLQFAVAGDLTAAMGNLTAQFDITKDPLDPSAIAPDFLGYPYQTNGHAAWSTSGTIGDGCSAQGSDSNAAVRSDIGGLTFNFAPPGSATYRKAYFPVLLQQPIQITIACPQGSANLPGPTMAFPPDPSFLPGLFLPFTADGQVRGTMTDDVGNTWQYQFTPKQQ